MMGCNGFLYSFGEVVPQVPTVGDLDFLRRPSASGFGIRAGTVAADHLGSGVRSQSFGDGAGFPVGENIDRAMRFHVDRTVPYRCRLRSAKWSEPSAGTTLVGGSGNAWTSRNRVERPTESPSACQKRDSRECVLRICSHVSALSLFPDQAEKFDGLCTRGTEPMRSTRVELHNFARLQEQVALA